MKIRHVGQLNLQWVPALLEAGLSGQGGLLTSENMLRSRNDMDIPHRSKGAHETGCCLAWPRELLSSGFASSAIALFRTGRSDETH